MLVPVEMDVKITRRGTCSEVRRWTINACGENLFDIDLLVSGRYETSESHYPFETFDEALRFGMVYNGYKVDDFDPIEPCKNCGNIKHVNEKCKCEGGNDER